MTINLHLPSRQPNLKPTITVVGVGGAGGNAVNNMINAQLEGVTFCIANTDAQALEHALTDRVIQLGAATTQGLGAGACPDVGKASAEEALDELAHHIQGSHMVFITAGMGGGTGTGAAPVVAKLAKEQGILTVAVVTKPFHFEGTHRMKLAEMGLEELQKYVDTMIVIPNQNLFRIANDRTTFADAFRMADDVLHSGVRGVTDLMIMPGLINLDFADIRTVMREMGKAMMGTGEAEGERRAVEAAEAAISNPLLDDVSMKGARGVLINITGGPDMTLFEVDEAANRIRDEVDPDANIIFGSTFNEGMTGKMRVSVVATGIDQQAMKAPIDTTGASMFSRRPAAATAAPQPKAKAPEPVKAEFSQRSVSVAPVRPEPVAEPISQAAEPVGNLFGFSEPAEQSAPRTYSRQAPTRFEAPAPVMDRAAEDQAALLDEEPRFISPRAAQPKFRQPVETAEPAWREKSEETGERNFIQRMASRFTAVREEEYDAAPAPAPAPRRQSAAAQAAVAERPVRAAVVEDDYLEIPAFLRRQAN